MYTICQVIKQLAAINEVHNKEKLLRSLERVVKMNDEWMFWRNPKEGMRKGRNRQMRSARRLSHSRETRFAICIICVLAACSPSSCFFFSIDIFHLLLECSFDSKKKGSKREISCYRAFILTTLPHFFLFFPYHEPRPAAPLNLCF